MAEDANGQGKLAELGNRIKAQREHLGLSIQEVQEQTKIRSKYLTAIEAGNDKIAPGKAYFRVFLKSYADFLGLDGLEFSRMYLEISESPNERHTVHRQVRAVTESPRPPQQQASPSEARRARRRRSRSNGGAAKAIIVLALIVAAIWGVSKAWQGYLRPAPPKVNVGNGNASEPETEPGPHEPLPEPEEDIKVARSDPSQGLTVFETNKTPMEITLTTMQGEDAKCWISVQADGELVVEKTMGPGETLELSGQDEVTVRAVKPWVLTISLNGQELGEGGPFGPVKDLIFRYSEEM